jgi:hypothetical protein
MEETSSASSTTTSTGSELLLLDVQLLALRKVLSNGCIPFWDYTYYLAPS